MNMNVLGGVGGPVGGQQMMNTGTPGNAPSNATESNRLKLNTYIYDYFLKNEHYDLARLLHERVDIEPAPQQKQSPNQRMVNGGSMDGDNKEEASNKPSDLPLPNVPTASDGSFLWDWWCQFWDCFQAQRGRGSAATKQYLSHVQAQQQQARLAGERQRMMGNPQMQNNMRFANGMVPNGMNMPNEMKKAAMQGRNPTTQQMQQIQQYRMQQQAMMQNNQMQREGSSMDINGQPRPQTPGSGENAPSPKRQRLDGGGFNGQMGPMGRGQPQAMQGQQFGALPMGTPGVQPKSMQVYAQSMRQQMQSAMDSNASKGMPNPAGIPQGSPAIDANEDFYNAGQLRGMAAGAPGGSTSNGNHALQDYQMQLMLLEQQNKRRLLMARQEQDGVTSGAGAPMPGQAGFPQGMSPRAGPSPTPDDQMKGTPKMAPGGIPQPNPDGSMSQAMYAQMKMNGGMMGPNGPMMPATSHPAYNQMNGQINAQQQMEMMRAQNGNRPPNGGPWAPGPPGPQMMPGGGNEQPPNMTPQQRTNMPPPPAPATGDTTRTQPPSPQPSSAAPPTPSQTGKPNAKGKKDAKGNNKKAPAKKGNATAATPASEAEQAPTPTPAPPITPTAPAPPFNNSNNNTANKNGAGQGVNGQQNAGNQGNMNVQAGQNFMGMNGPFGALDNGGLDSNDNFGSLDLGALESSDVLDNFDFDSFLNNDNGDGAFSFDATLAFGDGSIEAGGDV